jgi:hypothetical protein
MLAATGVAVANHASGRLTPRQLVTWVEWAFSQKQPLRREDSAVSALHEILHSHQIEVIGELPAISEAMMERRRESVARMPTLGKAMIQRRRSARWWWLAMAVLAAAAITALARVGW